MVQIRPTERLKRKSFHNSKLAVKTNPYITSRIVPWGTSDKSAIPNGVPKTAPKTSQRRIFQSTCRQTNGNMWILAAISSKNAVGTTSAGGKISDKLVTVKAEKPKPLYPLMIAASPIAKTANINMKGLRPVKVSNSKYIICLLHGKIR